MFIVLLKFAKAKNAAGQYMAGHNEWLQRGFDDGVFLLAGSLQAQQGGGILAHNTTLAELQARVAQDPFVEREVVSAEIFEIAPSRTAAQLEFLQAS